AVTQQLQHCSWIHLACRGIQDTAEPTQRHLLLYGGSLELGTILRMPLPKTEFAFLAACQTAMGDRELDRGFIAAGFRSVIGTLWSMNDQDRQFIAEAFYSHLFRDGRQSQASETAEALHLALHLAVKALNEKNVPYERWVPFIHMDVQSLNYLWIAVPETSRLE
ncbi:CHAT domain-containing protein, partial [Mycena vulgaris]